MDIGSDKVSAPECRTSCAAPTAVRHPSVSSPKMRCVPGLALEDIALDFGDIEPAAVLEGIDSFQATGCGRIRAYGEHAQFVWASELSLIDVIHSACSVSGVHMVQVI